MHNVNKVLITGATGCLGHNAAEQLLSNKVVSVRATGRDSKIGAALLAQGAEFVELDFAKARPEDYKALVKGCDAVWYCAGTHPTAPVSDAEHELVNYTAATELFKACNEAESVRRFIYVSTSDIYLDVKGATDIPESFRASHQRNAFVRSKIQAESFFRFIGAGAANIRTTIVRPCDFYGPYERHWLPRLVEEVRRERKLMMPRGGGSLRDFVYVGNLVYAMYLATLSPISRGAAVNVTDHAPMRVGEFVDQLFSAMVLPYKPQYRPIGWVESMCKFDALRGAENPVINKGNLHWWLQDFTLSNEQAANILGYRDVLVPVEEAIQITGEWFKEQFSF